MKLCSRDWRQANLSRVHVQQRNPVLYRSRRWFPCRSRSVAERGIRREVRWQNTFLNLLFHSAECFLGSRVASDTWALRALRMPTRKQLARRPPKPATLGWSNRCCSRRTTLRTEGAACWGSTHMQAPPLKLRFYPLSPHFQFSGENATLPFWLR